uniref:protein-tyrosine-phosphatase n=1 Tax=Hymenolepis diminuta TaxID=6216 RepID=A0A0R3STM2_HYMDI
LEVKIFCTIFYLVDITCIFLINFTISLKTVNLISYSFTRIDRFYFAISNGIPSSSSSVHVFSIDDILIYEKFYDDFGPFNLAQLYRYCRKVNKKLKASSLSNYKIVHYTSSDILKRTNAAFLVGCYQIIYLNRTTEEAYKNLLIDKFRTFIPFRDASSGPSYYDLNMPDCLRAVQKVFYAKKSLTKIDFFFYHNTAIFPFVGKAGRILLSFAFQAVRLGFLDFDNFDLEDYEYNEKVENGDLSWIVPNKFIAFSGPHARTMMDNGYPMHAPEFYLPYFKKNNVTNVIRLNQKMYDSSKFTRAGISHHDLIFPDGSVPSKLITRQFLEICESAPGVIAVHCKGKEEGELGDQQITAKCFVTDQPDLGLLNPDWLDGLKLLRRIIYILAEKSSVTRMTE